jgi:hypothetical protein
MQWTDASAAHDVSTEMTPGEIDLSISASKRFFEVDVPALNSGQMLPLLTILLKNTPFDSARTTGLPKAGPRIGRRGSGDCPI